MANSLDIDSAVPDEYLLGRSGLETIAMLLTEASTAINAVLDMSGTHYDDWNDRDSTVLYVGWNPWRWNQLPEEAIPLVAAATKRLRRLEDFAVSASREDEDCAAKLKDIQEELSGFVAQSESWHGAPCRSVEQMREKVDSLTADYRQAVGRFPGAFGDPERLLVADRRALLDAPDLQNWVLDGQEWTVVFLPQVLSELDEKKRDPRTRDAARKVINKLEELDRRGNTFEGVPVSGRLRAKEVPISPDMDETIGWLRADVPDDQIIAGALELSWQNLASRVAIAASDRNVRNKSRMAGLTPVKTESLLGSGN